MPIKALINHLRRTFILCAVISFSSVVFATYTVPNFTVPADFAKEDLEDYFTLRIDSSFQKCTADFNSGYTDSGTGFLQYYADVNVVAYLKAGYHFDYWTYETITDSNSWSSPTTLPTNDPSLKFTNPKNSAFANLVPLRLSAYGAPNSYKVRFNANGGDGTMSDQSLTYDIAAKLNSNLFIKEGYSFGGWATSSTSTTKAYDDGQSVSNLSAKNDAIINLYAIWNPNTYVISFEGLSDKKNIAYGDNYQIPSSKPTKTGYTFSKWVYNGSQVTDTTQMLVASDHEITAEYVANSYSIIFSANTTDDTLRGETADISGVSYDMSVTLTKNGFSRAGYSFVGWATSSSGSALYADEAEVKNLSAKDNAEVTLYAVWRPHVYTIAFDKNADDATGEMADLVDIAYNQYCDLTPNIFARKGYLFGGWMRSVESAGMDYRDRDRVSQLTMEDGATIRLYALWTPCSYKTRFYKNDGTSTYVEQSMTYAEFVQLSANHFTRTGYTFKGWATSSTGEVAYSDSEYVANLADTQNALVNLYAVWTKNTYTIKFDANGGEGAMADLPMTYDVAKNLTPTAFNRAHYDFLGWSKSDSSTSATYADKVSVTNLSSTDGDTVILYAVWKEHPKYNVYVSKGTGVESVESNPDERTNIYSNSVVKVWGTAKSGYTLAESSEETAIVINPLVSTTNLTLTATANSYTIAFDKNDALAEGEMTPMPRTYDDSSTALPENAFTKTGYSFVQWTTAADGSGTVYANRDYGRNYVTEGTLTLFAQWKANTYKIVFDRNGGNGSMTEQQMTYDVAANLTPCKFTRTGYTFKGWSFEGKTFAGGAEVKNLTADANGSVTLSAIWEANSYTIEFNANGGEGVMADLPMTYDEAKTLTPCAFTRAHYDFLGWSKSDSSTSAAYADNVSVTNLSSTDGDTVTLYAVWREHPKYNVNVSKGTGVESVESNPTERTNIYSNSVVKVWGTAKSGYTLAESSEETAIVINPLVSTTNLTLTATANSYTIAFDKNDDLAEGEMTPMPRTYDDSSTALPENAFSKVGYSFEKWTTAADGSGTVYLNKHYGRNYVTEGTLTLYAQWKANTYKIVFDRNGGSGSMTEQQMIYDVAANLTECKLTRTGYTFKGWSFEGKTFADGAEVKNLTADANGSVTLSAIWEANSYTIKFDANGGEGAMADLPMTYDTAAKLTANSFTKTGYTFNGWSFNSRNYTDEQEVNNLSSEVNGTVTMAARWKVNSYTITFDPGEGTITSNTREVNYGSNYSFPSSNPTRDGYQFGGWKNADGTTITTSTPMMTSVNHTLYAIWTANTYKIKFNANGGSGSMDDLQMTYDSAKTLTANAFIRAHYHFRGWSKSYNGEVNYADQQEVNNLTLVNNQTFYLYAVWEEYAKFDVTIEKEHIASISHEPNSLTGIYSNEVVKVWGTPSTGYKFDHTDKDNAIVIDPLTSNTNIVLSATPISYKIRFNANGGEGSMSDQTLTYDTAANLTANAFTRAHYTFLGWAKSSGGNIDYEDAEEVLNLSATDDAIIDLFAKWEEYKKYTVTVTTGDHVSAAYSNPETLTDIYSSTHISVWGEADEGYKINYSAANPFVIESLSKDETVELLATPISYTIRFNANGGEGEMADQVLTYDTAANLTANAFTKPLYKFLGWATSAEGEVEYTNEVEVKNLTTTDGDVIDLYAKWEEADPINDYTLAAAKFKTDGTTLAGAHFTVTPTTFKHLSKDLASWEIEDVYIKSVSLLLPSDKNIWQAKSIGKAELSSTISGSGTLSFKYKIPSAIDMGFGYFFDEASFYLLVNGSERIELTRTDGQWVEKNDIALKDVSSLSFVVEAKEHTEGEENGFEYLLPYLDDITLADYYNGDYDRLYLDDILWKTSTSDNPGAGSDSGDPDSDVEFSLSIAFDEDLKPVISVISEKPLSGVTIECCEDLASPKWIPHDSTHTKCRFFRGVIYK